MWRMASNVRISLITVSTKNRIFRAKRQLSLIPLIERQRYTGSAEQLNSSRFLAMGHIYLTRPKKKSISLSTQLDPHQQL